MGDCWGLLTLQSSGGGGWQGAGGCIDHTSSLQTCILVFLSWKYPWEVFSRGTKPSAALEVGHGKRPGHLPPSCCDTCLPSWSGWALEGSLAVWLPASSLESMRRWGGPWNWRPSLPQGPHSSPSGAGLLSPSWRINLTHSNQMHGFHLNPNLFEEAAVRDVDLNTSKDVPSTDQVEK